MRSRAAGILLLFVFAWYGVYRLTTWPIREVIRCWPGRRERLLRARVAQLRQAIADARQLVAVIGAGIPELQTTLGRLLRKCERQIDRTLSEQGWAEDLESENPWASAIRLLKKMKRVQEIDLGSDAADLRKAFTQLLSSYDCNLDRSSADLGNFEGVPGLQVLLSAVITQVADVGYILTRIDDGSGAYLFALCTPQEFPQIEILASTGYAVRRFKPSDFASRDKLRLRSDTHRVQPVAGYHVPGPNVPDPIPGRVGRVGGIESSSLDQRRYFFGFDYSSDRVLSPLLEDKRVMAEFAAAYMAQTDGVPHDIDYWLENVEAAVANSNLCDDESRTLTAAQLHVFAAGLALMRSRNVPSSDLRVDHHLVYLLSASLDEEDDVFLSIEPEIERLGLRSGDWEDELELHELDQLLQMGRGELPLPSGASFIDVAIVVRDYLERTIRRLPASWSLLFGKLVAEA